MEKHPLIISSDTVCIMIFATWVLLIVSFVAQAQINTELKMKVERLEDESLGINMPVTHQVKPILQ